MRRRVRTFRIAKLALVANIDCMFVVCRHKLKNRIVVRAADRSEFVILLFDPVEEICECGAEIIAEPASVADLKYARHLAIEFFLIPILRVVRVESHHMRNERRLG